jgi:hypothetical protein
VALSSNERGVVSVLEDAIMLCGNCSSSTVWLEKAMLTGATNNTISRNIEKYVAVKYPIRRVVFALTIFVSNIIEEIIKFYRRKLLERCYL